MAAALWLVALIPLALLFGVSLSVWESWWLFPLWAQLLTPLGVPPVTFWTFAAINVFLSCLLIAMPHRDYAKDEEAKYAQLIRTAVMVTRPLVAYYLIQWMVS